MSPKWARHKVRDELKPPHLSYDAMLVQRAAIKEESEPLGETEKAADDSVNTQEVLGMKLTPMTTERLLQTLAVRIEAKQQSIVAYQNLHGMRLNYIDNAFAALHRRPNTQVFVDGFPIYLLSKLLRHPDITRNQRITGNDFIWPLLELAEGRGWRVYFLGSKEEIVAAASSVIRLKVPELAFRAHHGYFEQVLQSQAVLDDILAFAPDLVIVCMGMPRQEQWMESNADALNPASLCAMGAIMSYISGFQRIPPRWLGPIGLEWLFRLLENPRHVWHRYLVEPWLLLASILTYVSKRR